MHLKFHSASVTISPVASPAGRRLRAGNYREASRAACQGSAPHRETRVQRVAHRGLCVRAAVDSWQSSSVSENKQLLKQTRELRQLAEKLSMDQTRYDDLRYSFAESLVTDTVGGDQLASGEAQYNAGKAQHRRGVHRPDGAPCEGSAGSSRSISCIGLRENQA